MIEVFTPGAPGVAESVASRASTVLAEPAPAPEPVAEVAPPAPLTLRRIRHSFGRLRDGLVDIARGHTRFRDRKNAASQLCQGIECANTEITDIAFATFRGHEVCWMDTIVDV